MDFDQLVDKVETQPTPAVEAKVLLDSEAAAEHQRLQAEFEELTRQPSGSISERGPSQVAEDIRRLMETSEPTVFRFVTVGAKKWSDLVAQHPPSKQDRARGRDVSESFWPAAMAASCEQPEGATKAGFEKLWSKLSDGQWQRLVGACREANVGEHDIRPSWAVSALLNGQQQKSE